MLKILFILIIVSSINNVIISQNKDYIKTLKSNFAKSENKQKYYSNLTKNCEDIFSKNIENPKLWIKTLRDAQSILLKKEYVFSGLRKVLQLKTDKYKKLQRVALEVSYTLYPGEIIELIKKVHSETHDPISFAISTKYLQDKNDLYSNQHFQNEIKNRFKNFKKTIILKKLYEDLENKNSKIENIPNLKNILFHRFQSNKTIFYSFHRKDRNFPGITIIKAPDGKFVRNIDSTLFYIPQLAVSFSNLPWFIPNGNTPQGIYSIVGRYISPTETIGPTQNVLVRSPFEVSPSTFYHEQNKNEKWNIEDYKNILPIEWQSYEPIFESFYAGKSGRKLIIIHGSTDETKYFRRKKYFPLTPTRGCLSSYEEWDEFGNCIKSDQANLINAFKTTNMSKGFLVVIEINDKKKPVTVKEIESIISQL